MNLAKLSENPRKATRRFVVAVVIFLIAVVASILITRARLQAAPTQPIRFSHRTHVEAGIECLYCHSQATRSIVAGIPSVERCMGCHKMMAVENEDVQVLAQYWDRRETIPWARVNYQPDFVYFSHQPHLNASLNCETCHGNIGSMDQTRPTVRMDMGWCLDCHTDQDPGHVTRLADCVACHK